MLELMIALLRFLVEDSVSQGALATLLAAALGFLVRHVVWLRHVMAIGVLAYDYANEQGLLRGLKGFQKLEPFMEKVVETYRTDYGCNPSPQARALALRTMEQKVIEEHSAR